MTLLRCRGYSVEWDLIENGINDSCFYFPSLWKDGERIDKRTLYLLINRAADEVSESLGFENVHQFFLAQDADGEKILRAWDEGVLDEA